MYMPPPTQDFEQPPAGTHPARCCRVIDLGTQQVDWQGNVKHQHKVVITWELPGEPMEDGRPFTANQRYTFSSSDKSHFRNHLESWRGKKFEDGDFGPGGFDIKNLLSVPCLLSIVHTNKNDRVYANVTSVMKVPKGMDVPELMNEPVFLSLAPDEFDPNVFDNLSDGLKETIRKSPEYQQLMGGQSTPQNTLPPDLDDEIPF